MKFLTIVSILSLSIYGSSTVWPSIEQGSESSDFVTMTDVDPNWQLSFKQNDNPGSAANHRYWGYSLSNNIVKVNVYRDNGVLISTFDSTGSSAASCLKDVKEMKLLHTCAYDNIISDSINVNYLLVKDSDNMVHIFTHQYNWIFLRKFEFSSNLTNVKTKPNDNKLYFLKNDSLYSMWNLNDSLITTGVTGFSFSQNKTWITNSNGLSILESNGSKNLIKSGNYLNSKFFYVAKDSTVYFTNTDNKLWRDYNGEADLIHMKYRPQWPTTTPRLEPIKFLGEDANGNLWMHARYDPIYLTIYDTALIKIEFRNDPDTATFHRFKIFDGFYNTTFIDYVDAYIGKNNKIYKVSLNHKPIISSMSNDSVQWIDIQNETINYDYTLTVKDPDNSSHTITKLSGPSWFSTPTSGYNHTISESNVDTGTYTIVLEITDDKTPILKDTVSWDLRIYAEIIKITGSYATAITSLNTYTATFDVDQIYKGYVLSSSIPSWLSINRMNDIQFQLTGTPQKSDTGTHAIEIIFTDSTTYQSRGFTYDTISYSLTIKYDNHSPVMTYFSSDWHLETRWYLQKDTVDTFILNVTDSDGDPLTYTFEQNDTVEVIKIDTNKFTITPKIGTSSHCYIWFTVSDYDTSVTGALLTQFIYSDTITVVENDTNNVITYDTTAIINHKYDTLAGETKQIYIDSVITTDTIKILNSDYITILTMTNYYMNNILQQSDSIIAYDTVKSNQTIIEINIIINVTGVDKDTVYVTIADSLNDLAYDTITVISTKYDTLENDSQQVYLDSTMTSKTITETSTTIITKSAIAKVMADAIVLFSDTSITYDTIVTNSVSNLVNTIINTLTNNIPIIKNSENEITINFNTTDIFILDANDKDGDQLTFSFDNPDTNIIGIIVNDNEYTIKAKKVGTTEIILKVTDGKKEMTYTITVNVDLGTGIINDKIIVYRTFFKLHGNVISYGLKKAGTFKFMIFNLKGQMVHNIMLNKDKGHYTMRMPKISSGKYIYKVAINQLQKTNITTVIR